MTYLQTKYSDSPSELNSVWEVGQPVVAQYPDDGLFYRAKIISKQDYCYKVSVYQLFKKKDVLLDHHKTKAYY